MQYSVVKNEILSCSIRKTKMLAFTSIFQNSRISSQSSLARISVKRHPAGKKLPVFTDKYDLTCRKLKILHTDTYKLVQLIN